MCSMLGSEQIDVIPFYSSLTNGAHCLESSIQAQQAIDPFPGINTYTLTNTRRRRTATATASTAAADVSRLLSQ